MNPNNVEEANQLAGEMNLANKSATIVPQNM